MYRYICIYMYTYTFTTPYICLHIYVHVYAYIYIFNLEAVTQTYIYIHMYSHSVSQFWGWQRTTHKISRRASVYTHIHTYVCIHINIHMCRHETGTGLLQNGRSICAYIHIFISIQIYTYIQVLSRRRTSCKRARSTSRPTRPFKTGAPCGSTPCVRRSTRDSVALWRMLSAVTRDSWLMHLDTWLLTHDSGLIDDDSCSHVWLSCVRTALYLWPYCSLTCAQWRDPWLTTQGMWLLILNGLWLVNLDSVTHESWWSWLMTHGPWLMTHCLKEPSHSAYSSLAASPDYLCQFAELGGGLGWRQHGCCVAACWSVL